MSREARLSKAWDVPPEVPEVPEVPEEDPLVLSSFFPSTFHTIHSGLLASGYRCQKVNDLDGRERYFHYIHRASRMEIMLKYARRPKGTYYCQKVIINGQVRKISDVTELSFLR